MSANPNRLSRFWQELKRRKVIKMIAMYAGGAYVLIELANNVVVPLNLPDWTPRLVIIIALVGFPIMVVLSWIFDITPEGIKKTETQETEFEDLTESPEKRRKLRASDIIIALLLIAVGVLIYPKIFSGGSIKRILDDKGKVSIVVMPFKNLTNDSTYVIWEDGIQINLISKLTNSEYLSVRQYETINDYFTSSGHEDIASISPTSAGGISGKLEARVFVIGSLIKSIDDIRIAAQIGETKTKEIIKTFEIDVHADHNILYATDSLAGIIRNFFEIESLRKEANTSGFQIDHYATSPEAYKYYILGLKSFAASDFSSAIRFYNMSLEIDSNFVSPLVHMTIAYYNRQQYDQAKEWFKKLNIRKDELSDIDILRLENQKALLEKDMNMRVEVGKQIAQLNTQSRLSWANLGWTFLQMDKYEEAVEAFEQVIEIDKRWGNNWAWIRFYVSLIEAYHETNQHQKEKEIAKLGLQITPDYPRIIQWQSICALSQGKTDEADKFINDFRRIWSELGYSRSMTLSQIAWIYKKAGFIDEALNYYREAAKVDPQNPYHAFILSWFLIDYDIDIDEGLTLANQMQEKHPENYGFLWPRGLGAYKKGNYEEALTLLKLYDKQSEWYDHDLILDIRRVEQALSGH